MIFVPGRPLQFGWHAERDFASTLDRPTVARRGIAVAWGALGLTKPHAITTQVPTPITTDQGSRVQNVGVPTPIDTDAGNRGQVRSDFPKFRAS